MLSYACILIIFARVLQPFIYICNIYLLYVFLYFFFSFLLSSLAMFSNFAIQIFGFGKVSWLRLWWEDASIWIVLFIHWMGVGGGISAGMGKSNSVGAPWGHSASYTLLIPLASTSPIQFFYFTPENPPPHSPPSVCIVLLHLPTMNYIVCKCSEWTSVSQLSNTFMLCLCKVFLLFSAPLSMDTCIACLRCT